MLAQWVWSWFNMKTLSVKSRRFKSLFGRLIQRKILMLRIKFDDLWAHCQSIALQPIPTELGQDRKKS
jgi:hypothetical protein